MFQRCVLPPSSGRWITRARKVYWKYRNRSDQVKCWPDEWRKGRRSGYGPSPSAIGSLPRFNVTPLSTGLARILPSPIDSYISSKPSARGLFVALMMEAERTFQTPVYIETTRRYIKKSCHLQTSVVFHSRIASNAGCSLHSECSTGAKLTLHRPWVMLH
jgi:hypothetical protein